MYMNKKINLSLFLFLICIFSPLAIFGNAHSFNDKREGQEAGEKNQKKICLTMIVKNEEPIIERLLNNVKDVVDCISICDTGSTDRTIAIIEEFIQKARIPGKVHRHEWKNFGYNRSLSVQAAQQTLRDLGFSLPNTYLLFMDADLLLAVEPSFKKDLLQADSYALLKKSHYHSYYYTHLVKAMLPWESVGVTHEYWSCKIPHQCIKLDSLRIDDRDDGNCKADKFERDARLLTQGLKDEPKNERYMFYLATTYKSLKQYDDAIKWYRERILQGGWNEEVWYSMYMIGEAYDEKGEWDHALDAYLEAYQYNSKRSEPLLNIARHYRQAGKMIWPTFLRIMV